MTHPTTPIPMWRRRALRWQMRSRIARGRLASMSSRVCWPVHPQLQRPRAEGAREVGRRRRRRRQRDAGRGWLAGAGAGGGGGGGGGGRHQDAGLQ